MHQNVNIPATSTVVLQSGEFMHQNQFHKIIFYLLLKSKVGYFLLWVSFENSFNFIFAIQGYKPSSAFTFQYWEMAQRKGEVTKIFFPKML